MNVTTATTTIAPTTTTTQIIWSNKLIFKQWYRWRRSVSQSWLQLWLWHVFLWSNQLCIQILAFSHPRHPSNSSSSSSFIRRTKRQTMLQRISHSWLSESYLSEPCLSESCLSESYVNEASSVIRFRHAQILAQEYYCLWIEAIEPNLFLQIIIFTAVLSKNVNSF